MTACAWCRGPLPPKARPYMVYCRQRCRQSAWEFRRGVVARQRAAAPLRLAYADPPYPGLARRYYADHPDYAGEVDHRALLEQFAAYDGWALSTSSRALPMVLGLAAELGLEVAVAAWFRGARVVPSARPLQGWEPVVFAGGRQVLEESSCSPAADASPEVLEDASAPGRVDALVHVARPRKSDPDHVVGAKPARFAYWMFALLGAAPGDTLDDLFPGSGGIRRAWQVFVDASGRAARDASSAPGPDVSPRGPVDGSDPSRAARLDASSEYSADASPRGWSDASPPADPDASGRSSTTGAA